MSSLPTKLALSVTLCIAIASRVQAEERLLSQGLPKLPNASVEEVNSPTHLVPPDAALDMSPVYGEGVRSSTASLSSYMLGPGDRISLSFVIIDDYSGEYQILPDGTINLPLVGKVAVGDFTIEQAGIRITNRYRRYLNYPDVTLDLVAGRPIRIAMTGEVNRPGTYTISTLEESVPNVTEAIQLAGGITQLADIRNVQVYSPAARPSVGEYALGSRSLELTDFR